MLTSLGKRWREKAEFCIFTLPVLICIAVAFYIPFAMTVRYSLTKWNGISRFSIHLDISSLHLAIHRILSRHLYCRLAVRP